MPKIFISYRRTDSQGWAGRLGDALTHLFGDAAFFLDIETIAAGDDAAEVIERGLEEAEVVVVLIGPSWLSASLPDGRRRLDDPNDFVLVEIANALARHIRVIPVLLAGSRMPSARQLPPAISSFAGRQAFELSDTRWSFDCDRLAEEIELRTSLRRVPNRVASGGTVVSVAEELSLEGAQAGNVTGVKGGGVGILGGSVTVEVAKGAKLRNATIGDIVGVIVERDRTEKG